MWEQTLDEVAKGELEGPLALDDIPLNVPLSKRFGVEQGGKSAVWTIFQLLE